LERFCHRIVTFNGSSEFESERDKCLVVAINGRLSGKFSIIPDSARASYTRIRFLGCAVRDCVAPSSTTERTTSRTISRKFSRANLRAAPQRTKDERADKEIQRAEGKNNGCSSGSGMK
jgi:hypothetical protein